MENYENVPSRHELAQAFGNYLRELLDKAQLSDKEVAQHIGVSQTAIWGMKSGRLALLGTDKLIELATLLNVNVDEFLSRAGRMRPEKWRKFWSGAVSLLGATAGIKPDDAEKIVAAQLASIKGDDGAKP